MAATVERETLNLPEFCKVLGIGESKGHNLMMHNLIPHIRAGRRILIPRRVVDELLAGTRTLDPPHDGHKG